MRWLVSSRRAVAAKRWPLVVAVLLLASLSGCATSQPKSELYDKVARGGLSFGALRVIMRDCARRFPAVLEQTATEIAAGPTTAEQRKRLIDFKANSVPLVQSVLLQQHPVAALLDGWALLYQLRDYLASNMIDQGQRAETVRTVEGLADELAQLWAELTGRPKHGPEPRGSKPGRARTPCRARSWPGSRPRRCSPA